MIRRIVSSIAVFGLVALIATMATSSLRAAPVTLVDVGDTWTYQKGLEEAPAGWDSVGFDDSTWLFGGTGIGYGDGDDVTVLADMQNSYTSIYARREFQVVPEALGGLTLSVVFDDGYVCDLNGTEVARNGVVSRAFNATATQSHEYDVGPDVTAIDAALLLSGTNVLACQVFNQGISSSDFSFAPSLDAEITDEVLICYSADAEYVITRWEVLPDQVDPVAKGNTAFASFTTPEGWLVAEAAPSTELSKYILNTVTLQASAIEVEFTDRATSVVQSPVNVRYTQINKISNTLFQDGVQDIANALGLYVGVIRKANNDYGFIWANTPLAATWWVDEEPPL